MTEEDIAAESLTEGGCLWLTCLFHIEPFKNKNIVIVLAFCNCVVDTMYSLWTWYIWTNQAICFLCVFCCISSLSRLLTMCSHLVDPFRNHGTDISVVEGLVIRRMQFSDINLAFHTLFSAQLAAFRAAAIASTVAMCWIAAFAVECGAFHSIAKHVSTCATRKTRAAMTKRMITLRYITRSTK